MGRWKIANEGRLNNVHSLNPISRHFGLNLASQEDTRLKIAEIFIGCQMVIVKNGGRSD